MTGIPIPEECKPFIKASEDIAKIKGSLRWEFSTDNYLLDRFDDLEEALESIICEFRDRAAKEAG